MNAPRRRLPRLVLVMNRPREPVRGGRELLSRVQRDALRDILGNRLRVEELAAPGAGLASKAWDAARGRMDGVNRGSARKVVDAIRDHRADALFLDGSNLGALSATCRRAFPDLRIITFFHNVEARFFLGRLRRHPTPWAAAVLLGNFKAERMAVKASSSLVCLTPEDASLIERWYGRRPHHVFPVALPEQPTTPGAAPDVDALFVGGLFYANRDGIRWFVRKVMPRTLAKLRIVGAGFEDLASELSGDRVEVVGTVNETAPWYGRASFVVAPIFDGSGMKTKVAEALMHGKRVVGTPQAFFGYGSPAEHRGHVCRSADEFVDAINRLLREPPLAFDPRLRDVFQAKYSPAAARGRLEALLAG